ncbi:alpha/beta fold hydrolase [Flavobacterium amniphilum]|uniref:alpha/beta fold hydrolase n=1 Tax=Flavobacterium amniphilum TaxID=1834035 RepID=UPI002029B629|nr:alpha/beta fold hydrolase [Flavobacterium amniphilum]MCL9806738.1 alpha/beta fold hydrolase [Flavobacterium amniphilum]
MRNLYTITLDDLLPEEFPAGNINLSYQLFGKPLGTAEVVLVNHALTGNSNVAGENGWWKSLVGFDEVIDLDRFTVVCFNIPGNGYCGNPENLIDNYKDYTTKNIAVIFWKGLEKIGINKLFAVIGGSLGGGITWEMGFLKPNAIQYIIPIATNYKATDWLIGNVLVQDQILNNSVQPIHNARLHAMLLYRTPQSFQYKFKTQKKGRLYDIESWLLHHGEKLEQRFLLKSYKLMNHLLKTIGEEISEDDLIGFGKKTNAQIIQVAINTDYFFTPQENRTVYQKLVSVNERMQYSEIDSIHGHDAFLIEYKQLNTILEPVFKKHNN